MLVVTAGAAYATIPDGQGVIHSCYRNSTGNLRVIDAAVAVCRRDEAKLEWNQTGPQGPQGPQGPAGPPGVLSGA